MTTSKVKSSKITILETSFHKSSNYQHYFFLPPKKVSMWKRLVIQQREYKLSCKKVSTEILSIAFAQEDFGGSNYDCTSGDQHTEAINLD